MKGQWVFGGYERESKKIFMVPVEDRTTDTLLKCIKEWILPGTVVISDCWKAYNCLSNDGFQHLTVNHSYNFVDPDTGKKCFKDYFIISLCNILLLHIVLYLQVHTHNTLNEFGERFEGISQDMGSSLTISRDIWPNISLNVFMPGWNA